MEFIFFYILVFFGAFFSFVKLSHQIHKNIFYFISSLFFIFIGMRLCGYDFEPYMDIYRDISNGDEVIGIEPSFAFLCYISPSFRVLLLLSALITVLLQASFIYKYSTLPLFSLFLISSTLLLPVFMGQMRQGIAIGFMAHAFMFFFQRKYWMYALFMVLAISFHFSAVVGLLFLILPHKTFNFKYYILILFFSILFFQFISPLFLQVMNNFAGFSYIDKLIGYSENDDELVGLNTAVLIRVVVFVLSYLNKDRISYNFFPLMLNVYFFSIIFYLIFGSIIPQLSTRGTMYFAYFDIILIPLFLNSITGFKKKLFISIFILLTVLRVSKFLYTDYTEDRVYSSYFFYESILNSSNL